MCHRGWEIRRELSIPAMDVLYLPSLHVVLPMSCESLDTILAAKTPTPPRRELQHPALAMGQAETRQALPRASFQTKSVSFIGLPNPSEAASQPSHSPRTAVPPIQWAA